MDKDQFDEQAERLLPCYANEDGDWCNGDNHDEMCPNKYRPAVAAALREQGQEISRLREKCNLKDDEYAQQVAFSEKMIADLRAENGQLKAQLADKEQCLKCANSA